VNPHKKRTFIDKQSGMESDRYPNIECNRIIHPFHYKPSQKKAVSTAGTSQTSSTNPWTFGEKQRERRGANRVSIG